MRLTASALLFLALAAPLAAQPVSAPHVTVELVPETATINPGTPFRVALRMELEKEWHTYWRNPGDAGLATSLELVLPDGFTAGDVDWPYPSVFGDPPEVSYGYHDVVLIPVTVTPPATLKPGDSVRIGAKASWLVCNLQCIAGKAELGTTIAVGDGNHPMPSAWGPEFDSVGSRLARRPGKMTMEAKRMNGYYELRIANALERMVAMPSDVFFFVDTEGIVDHSAGQTAEYAKDAVTIRLPISQYENTPPTHLRGVAVAPEGWNGGALKSIAVDVPIMVDVDAQARTTSTNRIETK